MQFRLLVFLASLFANLAYAETLNCVAAADRNAEQISGVVSRDEPFTRTLSSSWILRLVPIEYGWFLQVSVAGREDEDISRLTPPWHFVPNPRMIEGWHFRNLTNTAPNEGSVNAPNRLREFIFSPEVGLSIEYNGSATSKEDVDKVRAFGQGWLLLEDYSLTPPAEGEQAWFEQMSFTACLTWPA